MRPIPPFRMLDVLRGVAAAWVVMRHCSSRFITSDNLHYAHEPLYFLALHGQLGVMFFFIISGYCITAAAYGALCSGKPLWRFAFERTRRIYPPYLAALILGVISVMVITFAGSHHLIAPVHHPPVLGNDARYWIGNLFLLQFELHAQPMNVVFWSLCYEIAFYAVVGVWLWAAKWIASRRGLPTGRLLLVLGISLTTYLSLFSLILRGGAIFPFDLWHQFSLGGLFFFFIEFNPETITGYSNRLRWILNGSLALAVGLTVVHIYALRPDVDADISSPLSQASSITALLFLLLLLGLRRVDSLLASSPWMRPMLWLGACSYSLYLIHPVVVPFADILCRKAGLDGDRYWIAFWVQFTTAIVCGRIFYLGIERHFISSGQKKRFREEHAG